MKKAEYSAVIKGLAHKRIKRAFNKSKEYNYDVHEMQKRLWIRCQNAAVGPKPMGYTKLETGLFYYISDIIESRLYKNLYTENPPGKITGIGDEDFPGGQWIDKVHRVQSADRDVDAANMDGLKYSIQTGTGIKLNQWLYKVVNFTDYIDEFQNGLPTGNKQEVEVEQTIDKPCILSLPPWHCFPTAGASSERTAHEVDLLIPHSRRELKAMQTTGYIENLNAVDERAYNHVLTADSKLAETKIEKAKNQPNYEACDEDILWCIYHFGYLPLHDVEAMSDEDEIDMDKEVLCISIIPYDDKNETCLKLEENDIKEIPITRERYDGYESDFWGTTCLQAVEKVIVHYENLFGYGNDAAIRAVYDTLIAPDGIDQSQLTPRRADGIVTIPQNYFNDNKRPYYLGNGSSNNSWLMEMRTETRQHIDEIVGVLQFIQGADVKGDRSATEFAGREKALDIRLEKRMIFYEKHGLKDHMEWLTVLNRMYLSDSDFEKITGVPAHLNPFKLIDPVLPIHDADFMFEGSSKAANDPVKAQIYSQLLNKVQGMQPGLNSQGQLVVPNSMYILEMMFKSLNTGDDLDKIFRVVSPEEMAMMGQGAPPGGGGPSGIIGPGNPLGNNKVSRTAGLGQVA